MKHSPSCIPCFLRRVLHMAHLVTSDEWLHRKLLGESMVDLARFDESLTPPEVMQDLFRRTAKALGNPDPFQDEKKRWREEILANADSVRSSLEGAEDRFAHALRTSIAANVIDDELRQGTTLRSLLGAVMDAAIEAGPIDDFRAAVGRSRAVLFVHDSAGELFFDRLLIEEMARVAGPDCRITSVVRTANVLGDATREDATALGLEEVAQVVDPGLECRGLPILECSAEFRELFGNADLVVAKGQATYQTLEGEGRTPDGLEKEIWFLFRVKCPVMARHLAATIGDLFLERN